MIVLLSTWRVRLSNLGSLPNEQGCLQLLRLSWTLCKRVCVLRRGVSAECAQAALVASGGLYHPARRLVQGDGFDGGPAGPVEISTAAEDAANHLVPQLCEVIRSFRVTPGDPVVIRAGVRSSRFIGELQPGAVVRGRVRYDCLYLSAGGVLKVKYVELLHDPG